MIIIYYSYCVWPEEREFEILVVYLFVSVLPPVHHTRRPVAKSLFLSSPLLMTEQSGSCNYRRYSVFFPSGSPLSDSIFLISPEKETKIPHPTPPPPHPLLFFFLFLPFLFCFLLCCCCCCCRCCCCYYCPIICV